MFYPLIERRFIPYAAGVALMVAVALIASWPTRAATDSDSGDCDRACLRQTLDTYLAAVFRHDPGSAPLTADHVATLNTVEVHKGEGFWKNVTGYGEVQNRWLDAHNQSAAYFGLIKQDGKDHLASVRIKVQGRQVAEAEWLLATPPADGSSGALSFDPEALVKHAPPQAALLPSERSSRFMLISLANDYFQSVKDHDGSWIPQDPGCKQTSGPIASAPRHADICHDHFEVFKGVTKDLALRRFPVVDEEAGVVLGVAIFQRYRGVPRQDNLVHEYFSIRHDTIQDIWTSMYYLPMGAPLTSGWENR